MENNDRLNDLFNQAKNEAPKASYEQIKGQFEQSLISAGASASSGLLTLKNVIMIATITTISVGAIMFIDSIGNPTKNTSNSHDKSQIEVPKQLVENQHSIVLESYVQRVKGLSPSLRKEKTVQQKLAAKYSAPNLILDDGILAKFEPSLEKTSHLPQDTAFRFPRLTEEEKKENHKQKAKMIKKLLKFDKKAYAYIPSGSTKLGGKQLSIQAFYMQTTEVSNLEYRTYLFDLLIQGRKEEFLKAKPDQLRWSKEYPSAYVKPMEEHYFTHAAYDYYPVVAISREGAELYCKWLTEEANKKNKGKAPLNDLRIPSDLEWMYAAKGGKEASPYPWGGPYLRNAQGAFLANYKPFKDNFKADGGFFQTKVTSYTQNGYGLYCMSGNVAEMVYYNNAYDQPGTKGGSWSSTGQELQIEDGEDRFKGVLEPSVNIGFRPIISYIGKSKPLQFKDGGKAQNPPGTVKITESLYMDIAEITNINWLEYEVWTKNKFGENSPEHNATKLNQDVWSELNKPYRKHYYNHPAYRNYPVVGVSYQQAVAYCKWRTERVKEIASSIDETKDFEYRLPTKAEWERVAKAGYSSINRKKDENKFKFNLKRDKSDYMGVAGNLNDNADVTAPVQSYWPNDYQVYNMIGNVAEMLLTKGIAKGGSWKHTPEESTLSKDISYEAESNWLGFRCVLVFKPK